MKKISSFLAILFAVSLAAHAQTVGTANIMGYSKVDLAPGFTMVRTPFVDGTNAIGIQSIMSTNGLTAGTDAGTADQITLWDPVEIKYDLYFLHDGTGGKVPPTHLTGKWVDDATGLIASNSVASGTGFFFIKAGATTTTNMFSGDIVVAATGTNSLDLLEGFNMVANPFSSAFELNVAVTNWIGQGAMAGTGAGTADQITLWNPVETKYDLYFLHDGTGGKTPPTHLTGKWIDNTTGLIASNSIPINTAFFYARQVGAGTLTLDVNQPYTLD